MTATNDIRRRRRTSAFCWLALIGRQVITPEVWGGKAAVFPDMRKGQAQ